MAYVLTASQIASITRERDSLQETLNTYDSQEFMDSVNAAIDEANNVDIAVLNVWRSAAGSSDGVDPREVVLRQLDGQTVTNPIPAADMGRDNNGALFRMGTIQSVIGQIQDLATTEPFKIGNSARIRLNANRYYPDVDDKDDRPSSDSRNVFDDHPWEAWEGTEGTELDYTGLRTIYQDGIYGTARGTPGTTTESAGTAVDNPATEGTAQTSIDDGGQACIIGDNERFFIAISNYLSTQHDGVAVQANVSATSVSNLSIRGESVGGTCTIESEVTVTGTMGSPATCPVTTGFFVPAVGNVLGIGSSRILVVEIFSSSDSCVESSNDAVGTRSTPIRYVILNSTDPSNTTVSTGNQTVADSATKRLVYLALKRFTTAIAKTTVLIDTPAINTQTEVTNERIKIIAELGSAETGLYATKYNIANTRCNWNNGTLSAVIAREFSKNNLFSPANQNVTDPNFVNEYTRTETKIAEYQAILDGAS